MAEFAFHHSDQKPVKDFCIHRQGLAGVCIQSYQSAVDSSRLFAFLALIKFNNDFNYSPP
jgi:hypothetical protein